MSKYYARIDITTSLLGKLQEQDEVVKLEGIKLVTKTIDRIEDDAEEHSFFYSYLTALEYQYLQRDENSGYWICPKTGYQGSIELLHEIWVK